MGILSPEEVKRRFEKLKSERTTWESHWEDIANYIVPRRNDINTTYSPGAKRNLQILDNTGVQSNELLAGALHGLLTNPSSQWFELTTGDEELDNKDSIRLWLQKAGKRILNVLNNSNFQTEAHELYIDLTSIGTGAQTIEEDVRFIVRFSTKHIKEVFVAENSQGVIDEC